MLVELNDRILSFGCGKLRSIDRGTAFLSLATRMMMLTTPPKWSRAWSRFSISSTKPGRDFYSPGLSLLQLRQIFAPLSNRSCQSRTATADPSGQRLDQLHRMFFGKKPKNSNASI